MMKPDYTEITDDHRAREIAAKLTDPSHWFGFIALTTAAGIADQKEVG